MVIVETDHFSLEQICRSGQCFRMSRAEEEKNVYEIIAGQRYIKAVWDGKTCLLDCGQEEFEDFWKDYFDLERDYENYIRKINPGDEYLTEAAALAWGVRILRQDLWEMIVSFLISQQNNIVRIRRCINNLCENYGEKRETKNHVIYYGFPGPEALAGLSDDALMACNLGYRSKYVVRAAKSVVSGQTDLERLKTLPYKKAKEELLGLFGVGEKVADCVCLFALGHLEAFPVDTHISQALEKHYKRGFPKRRYKGFQGVLQQYIFYYELHSDKRYHE